MTQKIMAMVSCLIMTVVVCLPPLSFGTTVELPDLSIVPGSIQIKLDGERIDIINPNSSFLTIDAWISNSGPGISSSANVSFFFDGLILGIIPVNENITPSGPDNLTQVEFIWNLRDAEPGNHTVRVYVMDALGDANPADNAAEVNITVRGIAAVVAIMLDKAHQKARVTPEIPGSTIFTGIVYSEGTIFPIAVNLTIKLDQEWNHSIEPSSMILTDAERHPFNVTVTVPAATPTSVIGKLEVDAHATANGLTTWSLATGIVSVEPYFCITVEAQPSKMVIKPDETAVFELTLYNTGNAVDSYSIDITEKSGLEHQGWNITSDNNTINSVAPGENRTFTVVLRPIEDWAPYKDDALQIRVKVTSFSAKAFNQDINATVQLTVERNGLYMPSVVLILFVALLAVAISGAAVYYLRRRRKPKTVADYKRELNLD